MLRTLCLARGTEEGNRLEGILVTTRILCGTPYDKTHRGDASHVLYFMVRKVAVNSRPSIVPAPYRAWLHLAIVAPSTP
jgi:hypothetical protein